MQMISFPQISQHHCALIDASSLQQLAHYDKSFLTAKVEKPFSELIFKKEINDRDNLKSHSFRLLSRMAVYDYLVVDSRAVDAMHLGDLSWLEMVRPIEVPVKVYEAALSSINQFFETIDPQADAMRWLDRNIYEMGDKRYHDRLFNDYKMFGPYATSTAYPALRVFFYLEISRLVQKSIILHPRKGEMIAQLSDDLKGSVQDTFAKIEKKIDDISIRKAINEILDRWGVAKPISSPPLSAYIYRVAEREEISLLEAALKIRETKEARSFREWFRRLETNLSDGSLAALGDAAKAFKELEQLAEKWCEHLDSQCGITHKDRTINLGEFKLHPVPLIGDIGSLLKTFGVGKFEIKDLILNPKPYLVFISEWYKV